MKISCLIFLFFLTHTLYAIDPDHEYILTPDSVNLSYEELIITTENGINLNTWIYEADKSKTKNTVLVLAYPDAGNMSYFVYYAGIMAKSGYTVVTFDYRGFGKSDDFNIDRNALYYLEFVTDLTAVVNEISHKFEGKKIGLWGMSMGTIITAKAYPLIHEKIDFIIGEGYVTDTSLIIDRYQAKNKTLILPEPAENYLASLQNMDVPVLILAASEDTITTYQDAVNLKEKLGEKCQIIQYQAEHLQGFQYQYETLGFGG